MGAWGPGIFSNDTAADAREEWREALIAGADPRVASERIVARFGSDGFERIEDSVGRIVAHHPERETWGAGITRRG